MSRRKRKRRTSTPVDAQHLIEHAPDRRPKRETSRVLNLLDEIDRQSNREARTP